MYRRSNLSDTVEGIDVDRGGHISDIDKTALDVSTLGDLLLVVVVVLAACDDAGNATDRRADIET